MARAGAASLASAHERCRKAAELSGGSILVGLSGGKDSLVTLDVVCSSGAFARVEAFAMYLVPGLRCFEEPVRAAAERHGVVVHWVPHWDVARMLREAVLRPHSTATMSMKSQRLATTERALAKRTGIPWFAYGYRSLDGQTRAMVTRRCKGVSTDQRRLYPVWDWNNNDVLAYLRARRIQPPVPLIAGQSSGVTLDPAALAAIKRRYPDDYTKICEVFPYADAQVGRAQRAVQVPGV